MVQPPNVIQAWGKVQRHEAKQVPVETERKGKIYNVVEDPCKSQSLFETQQAM